MAGLRDAASELVAESHEFVESENNAEAKTVQKMCRDWPHYRPPEVGLSNGNELSESTIGDRINLLMTAAARNLKQRLLAIFGSFSCGKNCKFIEFREENLNCRGMHFGRQPFSRVAFPEKLLFDTFSGATNYYIVNVSTCIICIVAPHLRKLNQILLSIKQEIRLLIYDIPLMISYLYSETSTATILTD